MLCTKPNTSSFKGNSLAVCQHLFGTKSAHKSLATFYQSLALVDFVENTSK